MLALVVIGILCGHKGYTSIATWAREQQELKKALGFTHKNTPCAATFHLLFKKNRCGCLRSNFDKMGKHNTYKDMSNRSHWVRDTVLGEDASPVRCGAIPQVMAALRNTALSVLRFAGYNTISDAIRYFASRPKLAVNLIK